MYTKMTGLSAASVTSLIATVVASATEEDAATLKFYTDVISQIQNVIMSLDDTVTYDIWLKDRNTAVSAAYVTSTLPSFVAAVLSYTDASGFTVSHTWTIGAPDSEHFTYDVRASKVSAFAAN